MVIAPIPLAAGSAISAHVACQNKWGLLESIVGRRTAWRGLSRVGRVSRFVRQLSEPALRAPEALAPLAPAMQVMPVGKTPPTHFTNEGKWSGPAPLSCGPTAAAPGAEGSVHEGESKRSIRRWRNVSTIVDAGQERRRQKTPDPDADADRRETVEHPLAR